MPFWWKLFRRTPRRLTLDESVKVALSYCLIAKEAPGDSAMEREALRRAMIVLGKSVPSETRDEWRAARAMELGTENA